MGLRHSQVMAKASNGCFWPESAYPTLMCLYAAGPADHRDPSGATRQRRVVPGLEPPPLGHADDGAAGHEQMIQDPDVDPLQDLFQPRGDELVGVTEFTDLARVVMN